MIRAYIALFLAFLFIPIGMIVLFSFHSSSSLVFPIEGLDLRWYSYLFNNHNFISSLLNSVKVAVATCFFTTVLGTLTGLALIRASKKSRRVIEILNFAPIGLPGLFLGISLVILFSIIGLQRSLATVTIAHTLFCLPFFVEAMRSRITYFDHSIEEAARDLGASPYEVFAKVTIPVLAPTIIGGAILTFALSFDEFIITVFVGGNDTTLPLFIFSLMRRTVDPSINAASVIGLALSLGVLLLGGANYWLRRRSALTSRDETE